MSKKRAAIFIVLFLLISFGGWEVFSEHVFGKSKDQDQGEVVKVEGEKTQRKEPVASHLTTDNAKLTFGELITVDPDAPIKKTGMGEAYVWSQSAIAIDSDTGTILYYKDGKKRLAIASLTKVMTAVLVVENIKDLDKEIVTIQKEDFPLEGTKVGCPRTGYCVSNTLRVGEKVTARNLLDAALMNSANDAANALGRHIAGSQKSFADMMNKKAKELGLSDTHFCNPSGLDDETRPGACYSSAYDFARISAYSLRYKDIWETMKIKEKDFNSLDGKITHHIFNTDTLLDSMPNCLGGKTGFTYEAGKSLMMAAHDPANNKHRVVAVILNDEQRFEDMKNLLDWVFQAYSWPKKDLKVN